MCSSRPCSGGAAACRARPGPRRSVDPLSSPALLAELADVLARPKFSAIIARVGATVDALLTQVRQLVEVVEPRPLSEPVCRDSDDDEVLALALATRAELIISGDSDLLVLQQFEGVPIVNAAQALQRLP